MDFMAKILKEREEMDRRQAARANVAKLMSEPMDDDDEGDFDAATVSVFGKENSDKLKAGLMRLGGDMKKEGGYRFFLHDSKEREFEAKWIWNVGWMAGFDGLLFGGCG
jgi:hypothetical protein